MKTIANLIKSRNGDILALALDSTTLLIEDRQCLPQQLSLSLCRQMVGAIVTMPTVMAGESGQFLIEKVTHNEGTGDYTAWVMQAGSQHGHHVRLVQK